MSRKRNEAPLCSFQTNAGFSVLKAWLGMAFPVAVVIVKNGLVEGGREAVH
jgi:hypothetical protein